MTMNLYDLFAQTAREQSTHPALLGPGTEDCLTYGALDSAIRSVGRRLERAGVGPGACVGLHCPSGVNYIVLNYAIWRRGACVVPIPAEFTPPEREQVLRTVALDFVIAEERSAAFLESFLRGSKADALPGTVVAPVRPLRERPAGFRDINSAFIRFTSGTTAAAKGVVLSHETIHERITAANQVLHLGPEDRVVWLLSMAYHFAVSIVGYLTFGAGIVLLPNHFAQAVVSAANRHRGSVIYGSPAHFAWLAGIDGPAALPNLRLAISTTAPIDRATSQKFRARFGVPVTQALGIIEIGLPFINTDFAADRSEAVGRVLPAYRLRLEDVGLGDGLREVLLSGPGFLDAYYDPWRPRSEIMPDGYLRTGDVGEQDADGCLFLRGRVKDLINVLGMKFFPQEVEAVLRAHPGVESACVFARADARLGEVPEAKVVLRPGHEPRPTAQELTAHCRQQLADFKIPQRIEFVDALPRTASGKVLHRNLSQLAEGKRG